MVIIEKQQSDTDCCFYYITISHIGKNYMRQIIVLRVNIIRSAKTQTQQKMMINPTSMPAMVENAGILL